MDAPQVFSELNQTLRYLEPNLVAAAS